LNFKNFHTAKTGEAVLIVLLKKIFADDAPIT